MSGSTPTLSEVARHVRVPPTAVSTGWPAVAAQLGEMGVRLRWWQVAVARIILAKNAAGRYAATVGGVALSIPRQVGKTFLVLAVVFALCLLRPRLTVVWSAHRMRTTAETFLKAQGFARRRLVAPHVSRVVLGSGEEAVDFANGSRILFGARAMGFGRGFDEVDVVVFDEAQILGAAALEDIIPAMNQCRQDTGALALFMGTPPRPKDEAEVFTLMRESALAGDEDTALVELGADAGYEPTPSPAPLTDADWAQVARANPSFPRDTPPEAILRMRKRLGDEAFRREGLGIWDELERQFSPINSALWADRVDVGPDMHGPAPAALGVDMSHARHISIGACWLDQDGQAHVEEVWAGVDERAAVAFVIERARRRIPVVIDGLSPASSMSAALKARRVRVHSGTGGDMARACGLLKGELEAGRITHGGQAPLDEAVRDARKRAIGKAGGWGYDRSDPAAQIHPLVAVTLARYGATLRPPRSTATDRSTSSWSGKVVVLG